MLTRHLRRNLAILLVCAVAGPPSAWPQQAAPSSPPPSITGFRDVATQRKWEQQFLAVPDSRRAEAHLRALTAEPHIAGSPEDRRTAEYVAARFREAGLETEIVEYRVWLNYPKEVSVTLLEPAGVEMRGPRRERVEGDPFQDDPRVTTAFNGMSPSGDVTAGVVYANYGRPEDFRKLKELGVDVRGRIAIIRYGENFRGVKSFVAEEHGAAGVILYSDPADDGYFKGDPYPRGPWRPESGVQRGSIAYMFKFPGDPTTPGIASTMDLPQSGRVLPERSAQAPKIPTTPLAHADAAPILRNLGGPESPRTWQGALPFTYHVGPGPAKVRLRVQHDYAFRTIWNVIGKIRGAELPVEWVVAGNHRDAWVYGAVDPNSGSTVQLEAAAGLGALLKSGWRPRRTIVLASWDAEEQGLIGSTEWVEQHAAQLKNAVAYLNVDAAVSGPGFGAAAVPSLKEFIRDVTKSVPAAKGGSVYDAWRTARDAATRPSQPQIAASQAPPQAQAKPDVPVGDLGSGSDYTPFLQHLGVPAIDIGSSGPYGVYHSVFDNFAWFKKFADPEFVLLPQMARVYGLEIMRLASADVLPFDYAAYAAEITIYLEKAEKQARRDLGGNGLNFVPAYEAVRRMRKSGEAANAARALLPADSATLNRALRDAERALLAPAGLPNRPWFRHTVYAPGVYTGYAAVVIPGINEAIDSGNAAAGQHQIEELAAALNRAAALLEAGYVERK